MGKLKEILIMGLISFTFVGLLCACSAKNKPVFYSVVYIANEGGCINGESSQEIRRGSDARTVVAVADEGYEFIRWSDGITTEERQDKNIIADTTYEAEFKKKTFDFVYFTITYLASYGGNIEGDNIQTVKENENAERVIAIPNEGYKFVRWSDGITTAERQDKNIVSDRSIIATFEKIKFIVTYNIDVGGTINGTTTQEIEYGEETEFVVAVPNAGYKFVRWSDGNGSTIRREMNVVSDICLTAEFEFLYAGGDGSDKNPFTIANYSHLSNIYYYPQASYKLINDLDLSRVIHEPICDESNCFQGRFNGDGYTIKFLTIQTDSNYPSLFGVVDGGNISNLKIANANIKIDGYNAIRSGQRCAGVVAGMASGFISNVVADGEIYVDGLNCNSSAIGGLVGVAIGTISECDVNVRINIKNVLEEDTAIYMPFAFGGLIGVGDSTHIRDCNIEGQILVTECFWNGELSNRCTDIVVGGMIGYCFTNRQADSYIKNCKIDLDIFGDNAYEAGGFVGRLEVSIDTSMSIADSSVHGDIQMDTVGGFICSGFSDGELFIENCYVENRIKAYLRSAGFLQKFDGNNHCILSKCYSDSQITTHQFGNTDKLVGEAYGFTYSASGISFLDCYSVFDIRALRGGGFAFMLRNCILEKCYLDGRFNVFTTEFNGLFAKSLSNTQIRNCYMQSDFNELQDGKNIQVFSNMANSSVTNFYYVGSDLENLIYRINNSQINNFHLLRRSTQAFDCVSQDTGTIPSVLDISIYFQAEDMYFLANRLNEGLAEEVWINTLGDYPKLKTETNAYSL